MFEDPELQDPLSPSLNENCSDQSSPKKAPASPDYTCEIPEIRVIIKEEEDGWTVSENNESLSSEREKEDASVDACLSHQKASGVESSASYGVKKPQRGCAAEKRFEKPGPATESLQRHKLVSSDEKPQISCKCGKASGNVTVHQCNNTGEKPLSCPGRDMTPGHKRNVKSHQERWDQDRRASLHTEEELQQTKTSAPCPTNSPKRKHPKSRGLKMASENLNDQTLHLTVRLHAGEEEEEVGEEEEEEQDEEIGGLINSDGEVVEWDSAGSSDRGSDCTAGPPPSKTVFMQESQLRGQSQRDSSSPTLIMEVVSVGEDEEREDAEEKNNRGKDECCLPLILCRKETKKK